MLLRHGRGVVEHEQEVDFVRLRDAGGVVVRDRVRTPCIFGRRSKPKVRAATCRNGGQAQERRDYCLRSKCPAPNYPHGFAPSLSSGGALWQWTLRGFQN